MEPGNIRYGTEPYSKEELIAEMGACFLSNEAGIFNNLVFQNSAAYIGGWLRSLQNDPRLVLSAASQAQRAADLVRNRQIALKNEMEVPREETEQEKGLLPVLRRSFGISGGMKL